MFYAAVTLVSILSSPFCCIPPLVVIAFLAFRFHLFMTSNDSLMASPHSAFIITLGATIQTAFHSNSLSHLVLVFCGCYLVSW